MDNEHLTIAVNSRTDADGGDGEHVRYFLCQTFWNTLHDNGIGPGTFHGPCIFQHLFSCLFVFTLDLVSSHAMHGLGREADVGHHRDVDVRDRLDDMLHVRPPLELHSLGPSLLDEPARVSPGLLEARLVAHEGHVPHHQGALGAAGHALGVVDHLVHGDGQGVFVPGHDVGCRIPHQDHVHPCLVHDRCCGKIIGGQHREFFLFSFHLLQRNCGNLIHGILLCVRLSPCEVAAPFGFTVHALTTRFS